jgi:hypothetical protein
LKLNPQQDWLLVLVVFKMPDAIGDGCFTGARPKENSAVETFHKVFESIASREFGLPCVEWSLVAKNDCFTVHDNSFGAGSFLPHQLLTPTNQHQGSRWKQLASLAQIT